MVNDEIKPKNLGYAQGFSIGIPVQSRTFLIVAVDQSVAVVIEAVGAVFDGGLGLERKREEGEKEEEMEVGS